MCEALHCLLFSIILLASVHTTCPLTCFTIPLLGNKMAEKQRRLESLSVSQKLTANLTYMHRPPRIVPNYGKKPRGTLPKSNVSRVLLYDNVTQQQMLDVKISHIHAEQRKTGRIMDMHRKSFIVRRIQKQRHQMDTLVHVQHTNNAIGNTRKISKIGLDHGGRVSFTMEPEVETHDKLQAEIGMTRSSDPETQHKNCPVNDDKEADTSIMDVYGDLKSVLPSITHVSTNSPIAIDKGARLPEPIENNHNNMSDKKTTQTTQMYRDLIASNQGRFHLPDINRTNGVTTSLSATTGKVAVLHLDCDRNGFSRMLHTFHEPESFRSGRHVRRSNIDSLKTVSDERYRKLERLLVKIEPRNEGYLELSPSFHNHRQIISAATATSTPVTEYRRQISSSILSPAPHLITSMQAAATTSV